MSLTKVTYSMISGASFNVLDFGAVGDGTTDDTSAFVAALANNAPVYVPTASSFYVVTALTNSAKRYLFGPGVIKISGVQLQISSEPFINNDTANLRAYNQDLQPSKWPSVDGSLHNGASSVIVKRTGGFGSYGLNLSNYSVTAAVPLGQFDVVTTSWITAQNLTGGQSFGSWFGANTPAKALSQTYSGGAAIGQELNVGNRWEDFGLQLDVGGTRYTVGQQIVPDVLPADDGLNSVSCVISVGSPATVTVTGHGYTANMGVVFAGSGTIPTGLVKNQTYFVSAANLTTDTFEVSSSIGGASINTTGSFVAPITVLPSYPGTFAQVISQSVHGHQWWVGSFMKGNSIKAGGYMHLNRGGNSAAGAPASWAHVTGHFVNGLDVSGAVCSNAAINFSFANSNSVTATGGAITPPAQVQGYIKVAISGSIVKIPYYAD